MSDPVHAITPTKEDVPELFCLALGSTDRLRNHTSDVRAIPGAPGEGVRVEFTLSGPKAEDRVVVTRLRTRSSPEAWVNGRLRTGKQREQLIQISKIYAALDAGEAPEFGDAFELCLRLAKMRAKLPK